MKIPKPLMLSPELSDQLRYTSNCDAGSQIYLSPCDSLLLSMRYTVGDSIENPYAGAGILFSEHLDLSNYQYIEISVNSYSSNDCRILITDYLENFSHPENLITHRYWVYDLIVNRGKQLYTIPLSEFSTPGWWYKVAGIKADEIPVNSGVKRQISSLHFYNHPTAEFNEKKQLEIREIRFIRKKRVPSKLLLIIPVIFILSLRFSSRKRRSVTGYRQVKLTPGNGSSYRLTEYLKEHYSDSALSLNRVYLDTGIPEHQIRSLLKELGAENFRHYINEIRITEACRLLRESKSQIKEIAHSVGFGHISSFNRTFAKFQGESPQQYRQRNS